MTYYIIYAKTRIERVINQKQKAKTNFIAKTFKTISAIKSRKNENVNKINNITNASINLQKKLKI